MRISGQLKTSYAGNLARKSESCSPQGSDRKNRNWSFITRQTWTACTTSCQPTRFNRCTLYI